MRRFFQDLFGRRWGGQRIIVLPDLRSVVVITGSNYISRDPGNDMIYNYILPSIDRGLNYDFAGIRDDAPFPREVVLAESVSASSSDTYGHIGHWYGKWEGHVLPCQLVVEKVDSGRATVVLSWADLPDVHIE